MLFLTEDNDFGGEEQVSIIILHVKVCMVYHCGNNSHKWIFIIAHLCSVYFLFT